MMGCRERNAESQTLIAQVTTIHRKQVFLGPEQHRLNTGLMQGPQQRYGGRGPSYLNLPRCYYQGLPCSCRTIGSCHLCKQVTANTAGSCVSRFKGFLAPAGLLDGPSGGSGGARGRSVTPPQR